MKLIVYVAGLGHGRRTERGDVRAREHRAVGLLNIAAIVIGATAVMAFVANGARAWLFPWPIDYGEGPLIEQGKRILAGGSLYPLSFGKYHGIVSNYPPIYPALLALLGSLLGMTLPMARAVAAVGACTCALLIAMIVRQMTRCAASALLALALFVVSPPVFLWSMFARIDFVALAFTLASLCVVVCRPRARATPTLAALLTVLAVFARQSHLVLGPLAIGAALWLDSPRRAVWFSAVFVVSTASAVLALQGITHGGFWLHVVTANIQPYRFGRVANATLDFLGWIAPALAYSLWRAALRHRQARRGVIWGLPSDRAPARVAYAAISLFAVAAALSTLTIGKVGSAINHELPLVAAFAIVAGLVFGGALRGAARFHGADERAHCFTMGVMILQVVWIGLFATQLVAHQASAKLNLAPEFARLATIVRAERGPILADEAMGIVVLAGHELAADPFDLTQMVNAGAASQLPLLRDLEGKLFSLVLVHESPMTSEKCVRERWTNEMLAAIHHAYEPGGVLAGATLYRPKRDAL
jgi:hypothetical protein